MSIIDRDRRDAADILFHFDLEAGRDPDTGWTERQAMRDGERDDDWLVRKVAAIREYGYYEGASDMRLAASSIAAGKVLAHGASSAIANLPVDGPPKAVEP